MGEGILQLDQQATIALNGSDLIFWDNLMMTFTNTWSWTLLIIMLLYVVFHNNTVREGIAIMIAMALLIVVADRLCSGLVKPLVARWRPTQDPQIMYLMDVVDGYRGGRFGFFSGHACNTFTTATFLSLLFRHRALTLTMYLWSSLATFTRLYLGVHYLGDVMVGATVGILLAILFHYLLKKALKRMLTRSRLSTKGFTKSGYKISDMNLFLTIIFFNYIVLVAIAMAKGV